MTGQGRFVVVLLVGLVGAIALAALIGGDDDTDTASGDPIASDGASPASTTNTPEVPTSTATSGGTPASPSSSVSTRVAPSSAETAPPIVSTGRFVASSAPGATFGTAPGLTFSVKAEEGSGIDPDELVAIVDGILADPRSWAGDGVTGLERVADGGEFTLAVATPATVDDLCSPLRTNGYFSCARNGWVALNLDRWNSAIEEWPTSLDDYRAYVVNHEVGHYIRGPDHPSCPGSGGLAPVMMQQTKGLDGCLPNGWPYPDNG